MSNKPKKPGAKSSSPKVFDVSKPGGSAPNASSKPLIVTHRPMVQDPMVAPPADPLTDLNSEPTGTAKPILKPQKIKLQPSPEAIQELAEQAAEPKKDEMPPEVSAPVAADAEPAGSKAADQAIDALLAEPKEKPATVESKPETTPQTPEVTEKLDEPSSGLPEAAPKPTPESATAEDDKTASKAKPTPVADQAAAKKSAEAEAERQQQYENVIESHKYFVHISSPAKKRSMRLAVIGAILIILVAVGCLDAMLDAGLLDVPGLPHTNFIK